MRNDFAFLLSAVSAPPDSRGVGTAHTSSVLVCFALVLCALPPRVLMPDKYWVFRPSSAIRSPRLLSAPLNCGVPAAVLLEHVTAAPGGVPRFTVGGATPHPGFDRTPGSVGNLLPSIVPPRVRASLGRSQA